MLNLLGKKKTKKKTLLVLSVLMLSSHLKASH